MSELVWRLWNRKRSLAVLLSSVFCLLAVGHYCWAKVGPGSGFWCPRFVCEELQFDCGAVPKEGRIEHDFVIKNAGWQAMHLKAVPGCGSCSTVRLSKEEVEPGSTSNLSVVVDRTRVEKGPFRKQVLVKTDDPHLPKVVVHVYGTAQ